MNDKKAIIMMGLPLSGKTTWINEQRDLLDYFIVSADAIKEQHPDYKPDKAHLLHEYSVQRAEALMNNYAFSGHNLVMDSGSINNSYTVRIINMLHDRGYSVKLVHIKTPLLVCLDRNIERERKVPREEIIYKAQRERKQFNRLKEIVDEVEVVEYFTNEHIFIDMDGVIAAQTTLPIMDGRIDFVNSEVFTHQEPVMPVIDKLNSLANMGYTLYILSAAPTSISIQEKNDWLDKHFPIVPHERRFFVNQGRHKAEMLGDLRKKFKLDKRQVTLVDDYHTTLYNVLEDKMHPLHVSEFLTFDFKKLKTSLD